jgi:hypothetical protein
MTDNLCYAFPIFAFKYLAFSFFLKALSLGGELEPCTQRPNLIKGAGKTN